ncbi:MAG: hypothetical protein ACT4PI_13950 [Actinomycetota bacterium]
MDSEQWGAGRIVTLIGAVVLVVSGSMKWLDGDPGVTGYNVPAKFLVDVEVQQEGMSIGALLLLLAIAGAIGVLAPRLRPLTLVAGTAVLVVVITYVVQLGEFADFIRENDPFAEDDLGRGDLIGVGVWVGAVAGAALVVGGLLSGRRDRGALPSTPDGS